MFLWKPAGFLHNILRYSYMFSQLCSVKLNVSIIKSFKNDY